MSFNPVTRMGCPHDDNCQGGYRQVSAVYVDLIAPVTPAPFPTLGVLPDNADETIAAEWNARARANEHHRSHLSSARAAAAASSFPCPACNPEQFVRWQQGDFPYPSNRRDEHPVGNEPPTDDDGLFATIAAGRSIPSAHDEF